jgi:hypothetical protein
MPYGIKADNLGGIYYTDIGLNALMYLSSGNMIEYLEIHD